MNPELLKILRCPETGQTLALAPVDVVQRINRHIQEGSCKNQCGIQITEPIETALIRTDGGMLYPIRNNIPVLLPDEGIPCQDL
jgi:uncharacterized protein